MIHTYVAHMLGHADDNAQKNAPTRWSANADMKIGILNGNVDDVIESLVRAILRSSLHLREAFTPVKK